MTTRVQITTELTSGRVNLVVVVPGDPDWARKIMALALSAALVQYVPPLDAEPDGCGDCGVGLGAEHRLGCPSGLQAGVS